jgi:hypothetical protein
MSVAHPVKIKEDKRPVIVILDPILYNLLDRFQFDNHLKNKSTAIRTLLELGLQKASEEGMDVFGMAGNRGRLR